MPNLSTRVALFGFLVASCLPHQATATEAVMGRYIPGAFAIPGIGILPPMPGVYWQTTTMYYHGEAGSDLEIPIGGSVQFGLKGDIAATNFTGVWVPDLSLGNNLTLGLSASVPVQYMKVGASLGPLGADDELTSLGDISFAPMLGWHSGTQFLTASLRIFAPTGNYDPTALANNGLNYWTFSPTLAYTIINPANGLEFDITGAIDINTTNPATDYRSGAMAHLDAMLMQNFSKQFAVGVFGSILYQFEDDKGGQAARLDGFRGRSFAIGPVVKYTAGTEKNPINFSFSWAPEFGVKNRLQGNGFYLNISGSF